MPDTSNSKDMSVVLIACSLAGVEEDVASRPQAAAESLSTTQIAPRSSTPVPTPSEDPHAGLVAPPVQGQGHTALTPHQGLERLAGDMLEHGGYCSVEVGYCQGSPSVEEAVESAVAHGARRIVVVPLVLSLFLSGPSRCLTGDLQQKVAEAQARYPDTKIVYATSPFDHERLVDLLLSKIREYEPVTFKAGAWNLNDLAAGETAVVCAIGGGARFRSRVASLGFTPGVVVKMIQNYGHGAVIVSLRGTRVALGRGEARKVGVSQRGDRRQPGF